MYIATGNAVRQSGSCVNAPRKARPQPTVIAKSPALLAMNVPRWRFVISVAPSRVAFRLCCLRCWVLADGRNASTRARRNRHAPIEMSALRHPCTSGKAVCAESVPTPEDETGERSILTSAPISTSTRYVEGLPSITSGANPVSSSRVTLRATASA